MKFLVVAVLAIASAQAAIDLSKLDHNEIHVWPKALPEDFNPKEFDPRIVNGEEAERHQFPHQVALTIDGRSFCGGSIINENVVLTAAHCVDSANSVEVVAGAHNVNDNEESQQARICTKFIVHEDWDRGNLVNDIALIICDEALELDGKIIKAIKLDDGDDDHVDVDATVSGWGKPSDSSSSISPVLRFVTDKIIENNKCNNYYGVITSTHICLSGSNRKSSCNGDSGGPLTAGAGEELREIGIVSFGSAFGCAIGFPSAYTRVNKFTAWVDSKLEAL